jgi:uncharacterized coiled-coil protein SlyX
MTEPPLLPPPDPAPSAPVSPGNRSGRDIVPWLYGLGFLVLAAAIFYLWQYPSTPSEPADDRSAIQTVAQRLADMDTRLNNLERRPTPDISKITARLDTLEGRLADQTQLAARMDTLSGRIESLSGRDQTGIDLAKQQVGALTSRVASLEANATNVEAVTRRLNRLARLQEATLALAAGRAIGDVPDAPEPLARYAHAAPPTEADLRLPQAERAALAARQPDENDAPFLDRVWDQAQGLVTIRRGENVVVGNPAAVILSSAKTAIGAGDLSGAVAAVESLKGPPAQAMSAWLSDARALLDARAALARLATQA